MDSNLHYQNLQTEFIILNTKFDMLFELILDKFRDDQDLFEKLVKIKNYSPPPTKNMVHVSNEKNIPVQRPKPYIVEEVDLDAVDLGTEIDTKPVICTICPKVFETVKGLAIHQLSHCRVKLNRIKVVIEDETQTSDVPEKEIREKNPQIPEPASSKAKASLAGAIVEPMLEDTSANLAPITVPPGELSTQKVPLVVLETLELPPHELSTQKVPLVLLETLNLPPHEQATQKVPLVVLETLVSPLVEPEIPNLSPVRPIITKVSPVEPVIMFPPESSADNQSATEVEDTTNLTLEVTPISDSGKGSDLLEKSIIMTRQRTKFAGLETRQRGRTRLRVAPTLQTVPVVPNKIALRRGRGRPRLRVARTSQTTPVVPTKIALRRGRGRPRLQIDASSPTTPFIPTPMRTQVLPTPSICESSAKSKQMSHCPMPVEIESHSPAQVMVATSTRSVSCNKFPVNSSEISPYTFISSSPILNDRPDITVLPDELAPKKLPLVLPEAVKSPPVGPTKAELSPVVPAAPELSPVTPAITEVPPVEPGVLKFLPESNADNRSATDSENTTKFTLEVTPILDTGSVPLKKASIVMTRRRTKYKGLQKRQPIPPEAVSPIRPKNISRIRHKRRGRPRFRIFPTSQISRPTTPLIPTQIQTQVLPTPAICKPPAEPKPISPCSIAVEIEAHSPAQEVMVAPSTRSIILPKNPITQPQSQVAQSMYPTQPLPVTQIIYQTDANMFPNSFMQGVANMFPGSSAVQLSQNTFATSSARVASNMFTLSSAPIAASGNAFSASPNLVASNMFPISSHQMVGNSNRFPVNSSQIGHNTFLSSSPQLPQNTFLSNSAQIAQNSMLPVNSTQIVPNMFLSSTGQVVSNPNMFQANSINMPLKFPTSTSSMQGCPNFFTVNTGQLPSNLFPINSVQNNSNSYTHNYMLASNSQNTETASPVGFYVIQQQPGTGGYQAFK